MKFTIWLFVLCFCLGCNLNYLDVYPDASTTTEVTGDETAAFIIPRIDVMIVPFDVLAQVGDASLADAGQDAGQDTDAENDSDDAGSVTAEPSYVCLTSGCIHETEVTRAQYAAWLATNPTPTGFWECSSNVSFTPTCNWPQADNTPVTCIDWCDAKAFCESHGAFLCSAASWTAACSNEGTSDGPLGTAMASALACNTPLHSSKKTLASVKSLPGCKTAKGAFDLVGNAAEWTATNNGVKGSIRGGDYLSSTGACADYVQQDLTAGSPSIGFRCCK